MKETLLVRTSLILGALALAACSGGSGAVAEESTTTTEQNVLLQAVENCDLEASSYIDVDEAGLFIDGEGDESAGAGFEDLVCLLVALEVPDSVLSRMEATTSLMGVQEASFRGLNLSWTYHPSNGLDISIVEE